jgi:hypothetical protein
MYLQAQLLETYRDICVFLKLQSPDLPIINLNPCVHLSRFTRNLNFFSVTDAKSIQANTEDTSEEKNIQEEKEGGKELMEIDQVKQKYNKKTLRDEHGNYPVWMNRREVKKRSRINRKRKQKLKRQQIKDKRKNKN